MKKLLSNIIIITLLFFVLDYSVFFIYKYKYNLSNGQSYIENLTKEIATDNADKKYMERVKYVFRKPVNEDKDAKSSVLTGCSNIYGWGLNEKENISGMLSKYIQNPIYNISYPGWGLNNILYLVKSGIFFELVNKEPEIIIYSWGDFHVQRGTITLSPIEMNEFFYKLNNGNIERKTPPFFISRFAILALLREKYVNYMLNNNEQYAKRQTELNKAEFIEFKHILQAKYPNAKFIILLMYNRPFYEKEYFNNFAKELEDEGYKIINIPKDIGVNIDEPQYKQDDGHPNAKYWEDVMPELARKIVEI